ncbi:MAG: dienelactone hydrolase family protein [Lautropia sp.]
MDSLVPHAPVARRGFMAGSIAGGFAAAVAPVGNLLAQVIKTDTEGLTAGMVKVPTPAGEIPAYRAMPAGKTRLPTILVVQEIFGVHEYIQDTARRFAKLGYLAIAPELYFRQGDPSKYTAIPKLFEDIVSKVPDAQVMSDLDASVAWAKANGGDTARLGITGFCWGGRVVWLYSAHNPALKAGVAWYGRLTSAKNAMNPAHPFDVAEKLHAPVLGLYGGADTGIPVTTIDEMKLHLSGGGAASQASEFVIYPDAPHAFHADYRPSYRKEAAEDGWKRATAWFSRHGV